MENLPRVLVVDDEVRGLELAQRILRRVASVTVAESGEAALVHLNSGGSVFTWSSSRQRLVMELDAVF